MKIIKSYEDGPVLIAPDVFEDDRGYFLESFSDKWFIENVCNTTFVQDNQSKSAYGTIRGMHYQKGEYAQAKLVRVIKGAVVDVIVDIRTDSPNFMKTYWAYLSDDNKYQFFVPKGFAHGFISLADDTIFQYKCDNLYNKESEGSFNFQSVAGFNWEDYVPKEKWVVSEKDNNALSADERSRDFETFSGLIQNPVQNLNLDLIRKNLFSVKSANFDKNFVYLDHDTLRSCLKGATVLFNDGTEDEIEEICTTYDPMSFLTKSPLLCKNRYIDEKEFNNITRIYKK